MKERKYKEYYQNITQPDPSSGKEKRTAVYQGKYYRMAERDRPKSTYIWHLAALGAGYWLLWILYMSSGVPSTACIYVMPLAACAVFPGVYLILGWIRAFRCTERMTILDVEKGIRRVLHSFFGCLCISVIALIGEIVFLFSGVSFAQEWIGLLLLLGLAVVSFFGIQKAKNLCNGIIEE